MFSSVYYTDSSKNPQLTFHKIRKRKKKIIIGTTKQKPPSIQPNIHCRFLHKLKRQWEPQSLQRVHRESVAPSSQVQS